MNPETKCPQRYHPVFCSLRTAVTNPNLLGFVDACDVRCAYDFAGPADVWELSQLDRFIF
jgi:hypothetical protein